MVDHSNEPKGDFANVQNIFNKVDSELKIPVGEQVNIEREVIAKPVVEPVKVEIPKPQATPVPAGINLNDPGTRQFFKELGVAIAAAQPQNAGRGMDTVSAYEKPGITAHMRTIEGAKKYRESARSQTRRKLLLEPHTILFISLTSPLLPKDTQNAAHNKSLAVWSPSLNLVNYTIPAEKQIRVPLTLYKKYTLCLLSKTKGIAGYQEYQKTQKLIATDKFYADRGLMMFDFLGNPWGTSRINSESENYDGAYTESVIAKEISGRK